MSTLDPRRAPLFEALLAHAAARPASYHVPGHKSGQAYRLESYATEEMHGTAEREYFGRLLQLDLTELSGLDDLHQPQEAIREAQELAADCFGAERSFFLVGGSTVGNQAMVLAVCGRGDILLVQRNVHKSVLHGLMLAGARAVFLPPRIDEASGLAAGVDPGDVREALERYPEARGLLVTNPNYYGMSSDLRELAELVHAYGKPLLVDEAHGAHFGFHPELPPSALSCGADAVVQSTHKMLAAMTMGAMLHLQGGSLNHAAVARLLAMLQSSSPSYPIIASLDLARRQVHTAAANGRIGLGLAAANRVQMYLHEQPCYRLLVRAGPANGGPAAHPARRAAYDTLDPFKVTLADATGTLNGYTLQRELERRGCFPELAAPHHVLLALSPASTPHDADRLCAALSEIAREHGLLQKPPQAESRPPLAAFPRSGRLSEPVSFGLPQPAAAGGPGSRPVPLMNAAGFRSAGMVIPYPPGIPALYPGERITPEIAAYLQELAAAGARFHGVPAGPLEMIEVLGSLPGLSDITLKEV